MNQQFNGNPLANLAALGLSGLSGVPGSMNANPDIYRQGDCNGSKLKVTSF